MCLVGRDPTPQEREVLVWRVAERWGLNVDSRCVAITRRAVRDPKPYQGPHSLLALRRSPMPEFKAGVRHQVEEALRQMRTGRLALQLIGLRGVSRIAHVAGTLSEGKECPRRC